jgi:transposase
VFSNRRRNRIKVLYWDGTGMWVMTKRLEVGTFSWPVGVPEEEAAKLSMAPEALVLLLDGVEFKNETMETWYQRDFAEIISNSLLYIL